MPPPPPMPPSSSSWRSLASGASSRVRDYLRTGPGPHLQITPADASASQAAAASRQSWEQWARQKLSRGRSTDDMNGPLGVEQVLLFPGWATRRYATQKAADSQVDEFTVELAISGYATALRPPELATRSQRAFMRIARGFAALPKLPTLTTPSSSEPSSPRLRPTNTRQAVDMLDVSKLPSGAKDFDDTTAHLAVMTEEPEDLDTEDSSRSGSPEPPTPTEDSASISMPFVTPDEIALLHANLNARLRPFWASPVANRLLRLRIYLHPKVANDEPLMTHDTITTAQGGFAVQLRVPFELMCTHPRGVHLAFGERTAAHAILIHAQLLPAPVRQPTNPNVTERPLPTVPPPQIEAELAIPLTHAPVRVISDIDDTVKMSEILRGARAAFRNVFTRPLEQVVIGSMSAWYRGMHTRGVRFHYVSNSPFELLAVLNEFFAVARLPPGSLKLKFYGGRSIFHGLWEPAGERKRAGVVEILDAFPDARFILVGDTGEQDLELYAALARERPGQILGVFVRDVSTQPGPPLADPAPAAPQGLDTPIATRPALHEFRSTGDLGSATVSQMAPSPAMSVSGKLRAPRKALTDPGALSLSTVSVPASPVGSRPASPKSPGTPRLPGGSYDNPNLNLTPLERRRMDLQTRLERARELAPRHIPVRIFREPIECVEAEEILERLEREGGL